MGNYTDADFELAVAHCVGIGHDSDDAPELAELIAKVRAEGRVTAVEDYARQLTAHMDKAHTEGRRAGLEEAAALLRHHHHKECRDKDWSNAAGVTRDLLRRIRALADRQPAPEPPEGTSTISTADPEAVTVEFLATLGADTVVADAHGQVWSRHNRNGRRAGLEEAAAMLEEDAKDLGNVPGAIQDRLSARAIRALADKPAGQEASDG